MLDRLLPASGPVRKTVLVAVPVLLLALFTQVLLPGAANSGGRGTPLAIVFSGLVNGFVTALVAAGLVLIYRALRIINFAQTAVGTAGATMTFLFIRYVPGLPFPLALLLGLAMSVAVGVIFDLVFGRRFFDAPRIVLTVVTIVAGGFLAGQSSQLVFQLPFFSDHRGPQAITDLSAGLRDYLPLRGFGFRVGSLQQRFGFPELLALELSVLALVLVFLFFRYTRTGVAVRALAENSDRAKLLGISVGTMTTVVWAISSLLGGLSLTLSGIVTSPAAAQGFAPGLLLTPLAAAVIGKMENLAVAVFAAVGLQVAAASMQWSYPETFSSFYTLGLFVVVTLGMLNLQRRRNRGRSEQAMTTWQATDEPRPIPRELLAVSSVRVGRVVLVLLLLVLTGLFPFVASISQINLVSVIFINAIVAVSLVVLTGWAGQISLGQYGFVAVGALVAGSLTSKVGLPFWLAVPVTMAATGAFALVIGIPALRIRGLFLAVSTFAFALAVRVVLFDPKVFGWLQPENVERPSLFLLDFEDEKSMYFLCLVGLLFAVGIVLNFRRSRVGRLLIGLRENEANLQAFGISTLRLKILAFTIAGALCGLAGALYAHQQRGVNGEAFGPERSIFIFISTVIGGLSSPAGALLGAAFSGITGYFLVGNLVFQAVAGFLPLLILYVVPSGFVGVLNQVRDSFLRIVAQRRQMIVPSLFADLDPEALENRIIPLADPILNSGLSALRPDQRYTQRSELYRGHGERILEKLGPARRTKEAAAIGAAVEAAESNPSSVVPEIEPATVGGDR